MVNLLSPTQKLERVRDLLNHPAIDCSDIVRKLRGILKEIGYQKRPIIYRIPALVRATWHFDESWFDNVGKFSYPPKEVLVRKGNFGRCNWPAEPIFYCSSETGVPIFEVRPPIGAYVVLSHWESIIADRIEFLGVALGVEAIMKSLDEDDSFMPILKQDDIFLSTTSQEIKDFDRYVAKLFVEDATLNEKLYWLTSAVTKSYLENMISPLTGRKLDGLIYPSVASQLSGFNIVLTTSFVDLNLGIRAASMYRVVDFKEELMEYRLVPIKSLSKSSNKGNLMWNDVRDSYAENVWALNPSTPTLPHDEIITLPID